MASFPHLRPRVEFLSPELLDQIIREGYALLENPGVMVHDQGALQLLAENGAIVNFETQVARIPQELVRRALSSAPKSFDLYDLSGTPVVHYGGDQVHFDPGSSGVSILDIETGKPRDPVTSDFVRFVKLVETIPAYDAQSTAFVCRDVPPAMGDLYRLYLALLYMRKPIITGAFGKQTWWLMWEMLVAVAGNEEELRKKPIAVFDVCPTPPLQWSDLTVQNLIDCAHKGVPAQLVSMPLAGTTSPVTLAAAVVEHTAECLSGVTIHQLANPGAPIVWGGAPAAFDMRSGTTPMGDVNTWMIDCAYVEVGKALGLPTHTYMGSSDAKILDMQAGIESAGGTMLAALAGVNMVSGGGMIDFLRCQSYEKLLIDAEIIGIAKRLISGIEQRDESIALELMRTSAHTPSFLSNKHTHRWFRKELYIPTPLIDHGSLDAWRKSGSTSIIERAKSQVDEHLKIYQPSSLPAEVHAELRLITVHAAKINGMDELPFLPLE